ncbi:MAG: hypothetical protein HYW05_04450 [Candidatus Diapherotrites archaeon]|nr:hypothetical protein [Candidatus Diapherotrites archaeon]
MRRTLSVVVLLAFFIVFLSTGAFAQNKAVAKYAIDVAQFSDTLRITLDALVGENDSIIILGAENRSSYAIYDTGIIEEFPKEIVSSAGGISSAHKFAVLQEEPAIIEWVIPSLMPGEKVEFAYELKIRVDENALKSISTYPKMGRITKSAVPNIFSPLRSNFTTAFAALKETDPQAAAAVIAVFAILFALAHMHNPKGKGRRKQKFF